MKQQTLQTLLHTLHTQSGIKMGEEKQYFLMQRLKPLMEQHSIPSFEALADLTRKPTPLRNDMIETLMIGETSFFRGRETFRLLKQTVLPNLLKTTQNLRLWVAACSSGQEAYSLAMTLKSLQGKCQTFIGSDLSTKALNKARKGRFSHFDVQRGLPIQHLITYFHKDKDSWIINKDLKQTITWKRINLIENFHSLGKFHLIFARHVLMYMSNKWKGNILERLIEALNTNGILILGAEEGLCLKERGDFHPLGGAIYQKHL